MIFHQPSAWLLLLLLLTPLVWRRWLGGRGRARPAARFSSLAPLHAAGSTWAVSARWLVPILRTLAFVLLVVAVARPQKPDEQSRTLTEGIAIQLVVDRSSSMGALDFEIDGRTVDRLSAVKTVVRDFVAGGGDLPGRQDDLVGVITFARYADAHCPLTLDHGYVIDATETASLASEEEDGTAIGDALALGVERLRYLADRADVSGRHRIKSKVIILLTDGENNRGEIDPLTAAAMAAAFDVKVYTIGAGSASGSAPFPMVNPLTGRTQIVRQPVRIDEGSLQAIAEMTGGSYFRATGTDSLAGVYAAIDELEKTTIEQRRYTRFHELAVEPLGTGLRAVPPLLLIVFALLTLETLLATTRLGTLP